ncbi:DNA-formamidopyrimidine glycosylase [Candidatus Woesebacteria bacterium RIFCSPHIGHO2_01_FULL_41_10]|uniref:DNA-formamidopyrimidine glycosylase n=1 Tax=Candidatus Woesebacteria bacterium RIFCSPHIGHO2_01_FULL_41_10 TaxID=1802500 RepID=A0A1F7YST2_9BACT|nr:MAG: DNA-formamidopyrimidine glycosylase [Candidatus Woesebacteria bacterium RIFCSPHIGHO2_01_FULL_41_10]
MPELPEVESIKLQLKRYFVGHKVENLEIKNPKIFSGNPKDIEGAMVTDIRRFGKVLVFDFDNGYSVVSHIKLTGQFLYRGPNLKNPPEISKKVTGGLGGSHTHVIFHLDNEGKLFYNDVRRFGWVRVVKTAEVEQIDFIKKLGPEPFSGLTMDKFVQMLSKTRRAVKVVIMDQTQMSGVGNIYANDALFLAKIDPKRPANSLEGQEVKALYDATHEVLENGMKYGGASELAFVTPDGREGGYQNHTLVYGKEGQLCPGEKSVKIQKYMLGGRGTYWCPGVQK